MPGKWSWYKSSLKSSLSHPILLRISSDLYVSHSSVQVMKNVLLTWLVGIDAIPALWLASRRIWTLFTWDFERQSSCKFELMKGTWLEEDLGLAQVRNLIFIPPPIHPVSLSLKHTYSNIQSLWISLGFPIFTYICPLQVFEETLALDTSDLPWVLEPTSRAKMFPVMFTNSHKEFVSTYVCR